jgi:cell wall-associated NlpC family hydrolase
MTSLRLFVVLAVLVLPLSGFASNKKVLGKLGQAVKTANIHASPKTNSRVYYKLQPYEYLVLQPASNGWAKVLLQNGKFGYVKEEVVARLPYDVIHEPVQQAGGSQLASRGGDARSVIAGASLNYTGTPYKWGGNDPNFGIDCSGFVKYLYGKIGISLPRTAAQQALVGKPITRYEDLRPGDRLYFWENKRNTIGHTGIYIGNGYFTHSSRGRGGVSTDYLSEKWRKMLVAARR